MIVEYAPRKHRGFFGTFVQLGNVIGGLSPMIATGLVAASDGKSWPVSTFLIGVLRHHPLRAEHPRKRRQGHRAAILERCRRQGPRSATSPSTLRGRRPGKSQHGSLQVTNLFSVENKVIVVTGGLGQLGSQFATALAHAGIDSKPSGSADQNGPFETYPREYWDEIIDVNGVVVIPQYLIGTIAAVACGTGEATARDRILAAKNSRRSGRFKSPMTPPINGDSLSSLTYCKTVRCKYRILYVKLIAVIRRLHMRS